MTTTPDPTAQVERRVPPTVDTFAMTSQQKQRILALRQVCTLWPNIEPHVAAWLASWIAVGTFDELCNGEQAAS